MENIGKLLVIGGAALVAVGLVVWVFGDRLSWLGNLPGDIKIERPGFSLYFPVVTMLLVSAGLSFVMWLLGKFAR